MDYYMYYVVFKNTQTEAFEPIKKYASSEPIAKHANDTMHLLDEDLYDVLPAIEYIMHLPRIKYDLYDLDEGYLAASYDTPHLIIPIPDSVIQVISFDNKVPTIFLLANDCGEDMKKYCNQLNPLLGSYYIHELNKTLLSSHWNVLWEHSVSQEFDKVPDINTHFWLTQEYMKALPVLFLSRQLGDADYLFEKVYNSTNIEKTCIDIQWKNISRLNTLFSMSLSGISSCSNDVSEIYKEKLKKEASKFNVSVVATFPGLPKEQMKYGMSASELSVKERQVIRILGVHRAIARFGVYLELTCANESLFKKIDELEQRCKAGTNNKYMWKALIDLGKMIAGFFNEYQLNVLRSAKDITFFSDFPVGLAIFDDDEVPLQCYKKISYRPLTPLTRQFQKEMVKETQIYLGKKCKVAIAECIINRHEDEYVYRMSKLVYSTLNDLEKNYTGLSIAYAQTYSISSIIEFIAENEDADILYISAHGNYYRENNMAGIMVGDEFWMVSEDLRVPPIVLLSACHSSPRGIGAVNIADMFIRNGALTVLGTFVPVNAKKNAKLMIRLFTYILEAQHGNRQYQTLDDAWRGIVASNAIHELTSASDNFNKWMHSENRNGIPRIVDFQLNRCVNRLRFTHTYSDTISIIKEMLHEEGLDGKFGNLLDINDYFPESIFYQFIGSPENVFLYNEIFED